MEKQEDLMVVGNTEDIFSGEGDDLHLPAQAASVGLRVAFGANSGHPVRPLRSAIADERLSLTGDGTIKLKLKSPWKDGTESLLFSPSEMIAVKR